MPARTRRQARGFLYDRLSQEERYRRDETSQRQESEHECQVCEDMASDHDFSINASYGSQSSQGSYVYSTPPFRSALYSHADRCHRHRKPDDDPYTERVTSYKRRKPRS